MNCPHVAQPFCPPTRWAWFPVAGTAMKRVNVYAFYELGALLTQLREELWKGNRARSQQRLIDIVNLVSRVQSALERFADPKSPFKMTRDHLAHISAILTAAFGNPPDPDVWQKRGR